jgi:oligopeptide/dipeptide ABC transporter ATP-binding protein
MNPGNPLMTVRDLRVAYPLRRALLRGRNRLEAVRGVSFELHEGRIFGLVGESGCGKTTLARTLLGLVTPASGQVHFRNEEMGRMDARRLGQARREIQYLFQDPLASLSPRRSIWQTLQEPLLLYGFAPRKEHRSRIEHALEIVDLPPEVLPRYPHELSGGQRQRVALARALVAGPALIIADEPMSSLDVSVQARIITLIRKVQRELGIAFLLISHDLAVIQQLADDVGVMYLGEMVETSPAAELFRHPAHPYTRALLQGSPWRSGRRLTEGAALPGEPPSALTPPAGCVFHTRCPQVLADCHTHHPGDFVLATEIGDGSIHSVRCHLWNR